MKKWICGVFAVLAVWSSAMPVRAEQETVAGNAAAVPTEIPEDQENNQTEILPSETTPLRENFTVQEGNEQTQLSSNQEMIVKNLQGRSLEQVTQAMDQWPLDLLTEVHMTEEADLETYKTPGAVDPEDLQRGLNAMNLARYVAGLDEVYLDDSLTECAQYGSVLLAKNNGLSHTPPQPEGMPYSFYLKGFEGTNESNIARSLNIADSIVKYVIDEGIHSYGHRRWILSPSMQWTGMGMAEQYTATYVFDCSRPRTSGLNDGFVAWPTQNTPRKMAGADYSLMVPFYEIDDVSVSTTNTRTGETVTYQEAESGEAYFYIAEGSAGYGSAIVFGGVTYGWNDEVAVTIEFAVPEGQRFQVNYIISYLPGDWDYYVNENGQAVLTSYYKELPEDLVIPAEVDGKPVYGLSYGEFHLGIGTNREIHSLTFEEGIQWIGFKAVDLNSCEQLFLPKSIEKIEMRGFNLTHFDAIYYEGSEQDWERITASARPYFTYGEIYFNSQWVQDYPTHNEQIRVIHPEYRITGDGYLTGFRKGTTVEMIRSGLLPVDTGLKKADGTKAESYEMVGTGWIAFTDGDAVPLLLFGDVDGDAGITLRDMILVRKHVMKAIALEDVYLRAASPLSYEASTPNPTLRDMILIRKYVMKAIDKLV